LGVVVAVILLGVFATTRVFDIPDIGGTRVAPFASKAIAGTSATVLPIQTPGVPSIDDQDNGTTQETGSPAIQVSNPNADPSTQELTEQDVRQFVGREAGQFGKITSTGSSPSITKIEFLKLSSLQQQVDASKQINMPLSTPMCEVELIGDFLIYGPMSGGKPIHYNHAIQIFNAHTGNLVMQTAFDK